MAVIRWSPFSELTGIPSAFERIFGEMAESGLYPFNREVFLPLDVERQGGSLVVTASLPGFKPAEVKVTIENGLLTIDAAHEEEKETKTPEYIRKERYEGHLHREIALGEVNAGKAKAEFKDGMLKLTVPVTTAAEAVKIPILG